MLRRFRVFFLVFVGTAALLTIVPASLYFAAHYEPDFYGEALKTDRKTLEKDSDAMLQQTAGLFSAIQKPGRWSARFTDEQINGWLSVDLVKNHPKALPEKLSDPRVAIRNKKLTLGCRYTHDGTAHVISVTLEPYVAKPNVLAIRVINVRAGLLPVPLNRVLDGISQAAKDSQLHLEWQREGADPVALLTLPEDEDREAIIRVESLHVENGAIYIGGTTKKRNG